jgi:hypothetical protein
MKHNEFIDKIAAIGRVLPNTVQVGDYVQFGKYLNAPILWRVINLEEDGSPLLYSEKILCLKPFDAAESGISEKTGGTYTTIEYRQMYGSNKWENSNIREWLNSSASAEKVAYTTHPPTKSAVDNGFNYYAAEAGFLNGFSESERNSIKPVVRKSLLADIDKGEKDGGTEVHEYDTNIASSVTNYDKAYYKNLTEKVYIFDVKELRDYVYNRGWEHRKMPTKEAVVDSNYKHGDLNNLKYWWNWLRFPSADDSYYVRSVNSDGYIDDGNANNDGGGVVPALNLKSGIFTSGKGTVGQPYIMGGDTVPSTASNSVLSSTFDYNSLLLKYDIKAINISIIKYYEAVVSVIDNFMDKLHYYEKVKSEIIRDFNVIGLKLSKKYDENLNLTKDENALIEKRQIFFKKHFELGMNLVNAKLLTIKRQAEDLEDRLEVINSGDNGIKELAILEKEERASFIFIVENAATIIKKALLKIEYFEANRKFAANAVTLWYSWSEDYKVFKTTLKDDLKNACEDDNIDSEIYNSWYADWQKKRFVIEERFLPLIERGLKGSLINIINDGATVSEKVISLLQEYKNGIDKFYLEERKNIYQKFAFQAGGDLQEKFEAESELYKLVSNLQKELQGIIFSLEKSEDRLFLLKWAEKLLDLQVDEVLDFVKDKELSKISLAVLTEFADLKRKNFEAYISDSKAYSQELQRREKEYNSLIFKMRKELMK